MESEFEFTAEVEQYVEPFAEVAEEVGEAPAEDAFVMPDGEPLAVEIVGPVEFVFEEPAATLPAWLSAYLGGYRITITPENVGVFQEFADAQADVNSAYYTNPAVSGVMAQDIFDFV